uniref:CYCLIN domain-containing protein n=1 Tax=Panagrellus redivivus TaxID=6233 RepID=A0A7E4WD40_PANRE
MKRNALCTEFSLVSNLLLNEPKPSESDPLYLPKGENLVLEEDRNDEVRWICEIGRRSGLGIDTVGASIAIFDRVLTRCSVRQKYANCVAVTSMYLAIKLYEESLESISLDDVLIDFEVDYSVSEILRMERIILSQLDWLLLFPTVERFVFAMLSHLKDMAHVTDDLRNRIEEVWCNWRMMSHYRPSILALSFIAVLAVDDEERLLSLNLYEQLMKMYNIDSNELRHCASLLEDLFFGTSDKEN